MVVFKRNVKLFLFLMISFIHLNAETQTLAEDFALQADAHRAYEQLLRTQIFSIGPVGFAPRTSKCELALRQLLNEKEAVAVFKDLLANATTLPGKMYALLGLYLTNREDFKQELKKYRAERGMEGGLYTQMGCEIMEVNEEDVLTAIETGRYDPLPHIFHFNTINR